MICDRIENRTTYPFSNLWNEAFKFLETLTPDSACGRYELQGKDLFVMIDSYETRTRDDAKLETHNNYMDIQYMISGNETHEVYAKKDLTVSEPYDPNKDAEFYQIPEAAPVTVHLQPGNFTAYFPHDAHMPCLTTGSEPSSVKKAVVKIRIEALG
jgi:YhcH/YjgK/YiaL family protein